MINLLSPTSKRRIRAARQNVVLRRYVLFIGFIALLIFATFGAGYYLTVQDRNRLQAEMQSKDSELAKYRATKASSEQLTKNLTIAKQIFSNEVVFSDLILDITKTLPRGVVLAELNITTDMLGKEVTIAARGEDSDSSPLSLKAALEQSSLFSNVKIISIDEKVFDNPTQATPIERRYPASFELSATLSPTAGKRQAGGGTQ